MTESSIHSSGSTPSVAPPVVVTGGQKGHARVAQLDPCGSARSRGAARVAVAGDFDLHLPARALRQSAHVVEELAAFADAAILLGARDVAPVRALVLGQR